MGVIMSYMQYAVIKLQKVQRTFKLTFTNSGFMCSPAIKFKNLSFKSAPTAAAVIWTARHGAEPVK